MNSVPASCTSRSLSPSRSAARSVCAGLLTGAVVLLSACGGGGGGGGTTPTTSPGDGFGTPSPGVTTYALLAGFRALTAAGSSVNFVVSGDCTGTASTISGAGVASSFEGVNGFSTAQVATLSIPSCSNQTTRSTRTSYYDVNYAPLGSVDSTSGVYTSIAGNPLALPARVKVGDAAPVYFVYNLYTDSSKSTRAGQVVEGFSIEADTASPSTSANTAIYHATSKSYDVRNNLQSTQQIYYRMQPDGTLTLLSLDTQFNSFIVEHYIYTPVN